MSSLTSSTHLLSLPYELLQQTHDHACPDRSRLVSLSSTQLVKSQDIPFSLVCRKFAQIARYTTDRYPTRDRNLILDDDAFTSLGVEPAATDVEFSRWMSDNGEKVKSWLTERHGDLGALIISHGSLSDWKRSHTFLRRTIRWIVQNESFPPVRDIVIDDTTPSDGTQESPWSYGGVEVLFTLLLLSKTCPETETDWVWGDHVPDNFDDLPQRLTIYSAQRPDLSRKEQQESKFPIRWYKTDSDTGKISWGGEGDFGQTISS